MPKSHFSLDLRKANFYLARQVANRPWITTAAFSTLLGVALIVLGVLKSGPVSIKATRGNSGTVNPQMDGKVGDTSWRDVRLYQDNDLWATLVFGLGTGLISVVVVEVAKIFGEQHSKTYQLKRFDQFFGQGASSRAVRGRIVLQADRIETLIENLSGKDSPTTQSVRAALDQPKNNRLHKARKWVNARDAESAGIVRDGIRKAGFPTPDLHVSQHYESRRDPFEDHAAAPYVISMGLAFTDTTIALASLIGGRDKCLYIEKGTDLGDAVVVRDKYLKKEYDNLDLVKACLPVYLSDKPCSYIFPSGWKLSDWLNKEPDLKDYALIIRHTAKVGNRTQIRFILAGFTEDSTVAAGRYLVAKWEDLWRRFIEDKRPGETDFVAVISGDAHTEQPWPDDADIELDHQDLMGARK